MGKNKTRIHDWAGGLFLPDRFVMLAPELLAHPQYQSVSFAGRYLYIVLITHRETPEAQGCLYNALAEYNQIFDLGWSDDDLRNEAFPSKRSRYVKGYFVAPLSQMIQYGFTKDYLTKLKKELIAKGLIKVKFAGKGQHSGWRKNVTVYEFCTEWMKA